MIQPAAGVTALNAKLREVLDWVQTIDADTAFPRDIRIAREIAARCLDLADQFEHSIGFVRQAQRDEADRIRRAEIPCPAEWPDDDFLPDDCKLGPRRAARGRYE